MSELRSAGAALTGPTGALLTIGLLAAAGNFGSGQSGLGALSLIGKIVFDDSMERLLIGLDAENGLGEFYLTDSFAGHVVNLDCRHLTLSFLSLSQTSSAGWCLR